MAAEGGCSTTSSSNCSNDDGLDIGTAIYEGGSGGNGSGSYGGGGGGAAGPNGAGKKGSNASSSSGGAGGGGDAGYGGSGGAGSSTVGSSGGAGAEYTATGGGTAGSGGGGGGGKTASGGGGAYGAGAGGNKSGTTGGSGLIVITYLPNPALFVTNLTSSAVTAYPVGSSGNIAPFSPQTGSSTGWLAATFGIARDSSGNIYVANENAGVTIYPPGATGNATPTANICCSNWGIYNPTGLTLDSKGNIYVANAGSIAGYPDSITVYALGTNNSITQTATITGSATGLAYPTAITVDSSANIYVANAGSQIGGVDSITVYPAGSNGNVSPSYTISGTNTGLVVPRGIALDSSVNIYVANDGMMIGVSDSVTVYAPGSTGNAAPTSTITGSSTGLDSPEGIAIDSSGNIYVTNDGSLYASADSITVYAPGSNGNAVPSANLFALGLDIPLGIVVDSGGNLYVANDGSDNGGVDAVTVYPPNNLVPSETIDSDTALNQPAGVTVDSSGKIYVTNDGSTGGGLDSINVYPPGSYAGVPLSTAIVGTNTGLTLPFGITNSGGNLYVANSAGGPDGLGSVTVYPSSSNGNVAPSVTISGNSSSDNTGFNFPSGIALDSSGNLYVANVNGGPDGAGSITIYPAGSSGNVTPTAAISDNPSCAPCDNTGLSSPYGVALDSSGNIYVANSVGGPDGMGSITIYPPLGSSTGTLNEAPSATIAGGSKSDITGFELPSGIALDSSANIYVTNQGSLVGVPDSITVYSARSSGNLAPSATIAGSSTGLGTPQGIAIGSNGGSTGDSLPPHKRKKRRRRE